MSNRRQNYQNIAWFLDLHRRGLLDMDPPYQRRSVWNRAYREHFIDTILLDYPSPAIFLFSRVEETAKTTYELVDGKQRLSTIFDFVDGEFPIGERSELTSLRGLFFDSLDREQKIRFYQYDFSVEYLPTNNVEVINSIFDRLNRNVAKLSNQELRHARFDGEFISTAEELAEWMTHKFDPPFPRIAPATRRQMKDVEIVATLLLFLEVGPRRHSIEEFDAAFAERDECWESRSSVAAEFKKTIEIFEKLINHDEGRFLAQSRFKNQADFYSLFAAIAELKREKQFPSLTEAVTRLKSLNDLLDDPDANPVASMYIAAARSNSHDTKQRLTRISITKHALAGKPIDQWKPHHDSPGDQAQV